MRSRTIGLSLMMLSTMAVSTLSFFALAVAASELQAEFAISKFQLGLLGAVNTGVGAILAPASGRFSDKVGGRSAVATTLIFTGVSAVLLAVSPNYIFLLFASAIGGVAQGLGNPATNKAISAGVSEASRGIVTGVKQSGVQASVFIAGVTVPVMSASFGWRSAMWLTAGITAALTLGLGVVPTREEPTPMDKSQVERSRKLPMFVTQLAIFGFLLGTIGGGFGRFLPLFAEEAVGLSVEQAGQVFALQGLVAVPARLTAGIVLDRGASAKKMMIMMAVLGAGSLLIVTAASAERPSLIWIGTIIAGLTLGTWNTAANLSMIRQRENAGIATGRLMFGFLLGLTLGGPLVGWSIDRFDYTPAWLASSALALIAAAVVARRSSPREPAVGHVESVR